MHRNKCLCESRYWLHSLVKMETWKWETGQKQACRVCSITLKKTRGCNCCQTCSNNLLSKDWTLVYTLHIFTLLFWGIWRQKMNWIHFDNRLQHVSSDDFDPWCSSLLFLSFMVTFVFANIFFTVSFSGFTKNNSCGRESSFPFWELFLIFTDDEWWFHTSK